MPVLTGRFKKKLNQ